MFFDLDSLLFSAFTINHPIQKTSILPGYMYTYLIPKVKVS
jgi:hypothetical protein